MSFLPKVINGELEKPKIKRRATRRGKKKPKNLWKKHKAHKKKKLTWQQYMPSREWLQRRLDYWKKHGKECKACGSLKRPTVHHVHYGYLGREKDEHIVGLCWDCHQDFHHEYGTKTVMQEETLEFIEKKQFPPLA